jgi:hypothetical protein
MPLTVSQIANRIAADGADKAALIERLRHWTREGLLAPSGDRNPGTGRRRLYEDSAVFDAAILNSLADSGFQLVQQRNLLVAMALYVQRAKQDWKKGKRDPFLFLEIANFGDANPQGGTGAVFLHEGRADLIHPRADSSIVLNLSRIFTRLEKKKPVAAKRKLKAR